MRGEKFIGHGKNVLGDPRVALAWLANELRQLGVNVEGGPGGHHGHLPPAAADHRPATVCAADFGVLGKVSVGFG